jgi:hypothetical protein
MDIVMPSAFPATEFQAFAKAAATLFLPFVSKENVFDPQETRRQFEWAWQAVRYRYRLCTECNEKVKALMADPSQMWQAGMDEEVMYKLERCIYVFFMSGLSVFESFGFCLYFLASAIRPDAFPYVSKPKKIKLCTASKAFTAAFPQAAITARLAELLQKSKFRTLDDLRNILAHRLSGRCSPLADWLSHTDEKTWHIPGSDEKLKFGEELLQQYLDNITALLLPLVLASREFAENNRAAKEQEPQ